MYSHHSNKSLIVLIITFFIWSLNSSLTIYLSQTPSQPRKIEYSILPGSKVSVVGSTNINEFTCFSEEAGSKKNTAYNYNEMLQIIYFQNAVFNIAVKSLDCSNVVMNANLCRTLNAEKFPYITIKLDSVKAINGKSFNLKEWQKLQANVVISLAGVERFNRIYFSGKEIQARVYHFIGEHELSLSDYQLQSPAALFGMIKVHDNVKVKFDLIISTSEMFEQ